MKYASFHLLYKGRLDFQRLRTSKEIGYEPREIKIRQGILSGRYIRGNQGFYQVVKNSLFDQGFWEDDQALSGK